MPTLSVGTLLFQLYALLCWFVQLIFLSVVCTTLSVGILTLSVVHTTLLVGTLPCLLYAQVCQLIQYSASCMHYTGGWYITLSVART